MLSRLILCAFLAALASWYEPATTQGELLREAVKGGSGTMAQAIAPAPSSPGVTRPPKQAFVPPPLGTWSTLPNTAIWPVIPIEAKQGQPGDAGNPELWSPRAIFAYSGGDLATLNGVLGFLYWGGGHGDSADNSLYFAPFDGSGPRRLSGPYLAPDKIYKYEDGLDHYRGVSRNQPGITVAAAPKARHTYSNLITITINWKPYLFCVGGSLTSGSGGGTNATRLFDLSLTHAQAMARPDMGWARRAHAPAGITAGSSGWDPKTGRVITRGKNFWGAYDPVADVWDRWGDAGGGSDYEASVAMDIEGRKMYVLGGHLAEMVNLDTHAVTVLGTWDGTIARGPAWLKGFLTPLWLGGYPKGPGVQWHPGRKRLLAYIGGGVGGSQDILQIDPVGGTTEVLKMGGVRVVTQNGYAIYGRFRLIPGTDTVVLAGTVETDVFIGQLPVSGTAARLAPGPIPLGDRPSRPQQTVMPGVFLPLSWR